MRTRYLLLSCILLSIIATACSFNLPFPNIQGTTSVDSGATFTPASVVSSDIAAPASSLLAPVDLTELYETVNPGVVSVVTYTNPGPPHGERILLGQGMSCRMP